MQDPYQNADPCDDAAAGVEFESMDEGLEDDESSDDGATKNRRGDYSTIAKKHSTVQKFIVSGLTEFEFLEMHPNIQASTLDTIHFKPLKKIEGFKDPFKHILLACDPQQILIVYKKLAAPAFYPLYQSREGPINSASLGNKARDNQGQSQGQRWGTKHRPHPLSTRLPKPPGPHKRRLFGE